MKVLAVMGSPRKGNSFKITQLIEERMKKLGNIEFEYLFLNEVDLGQCIGCHICVMKGEGSCPLKGDRARIEEQMINAHGVIFVSPIYSFHITCIMKKFIDRFTFLVHRPKFFNKPTLVFVQRGGLFKDALNYLSKVAKSWGFNVVSKLGIPDLESLTPKYKEKCLKEINTAAEKFHKAILEKKVLRPSLYDLIWFGIWRGNSIVCKDIMPADYKHWTEQGWFDRDYYYDVKVSTIKKVIANLFLKISGVFMRRVFNGY